MSGNAFMAALESWLRVNFWGKPPAKPKAPKEDQRGQDTPAGDPEPTGPGVKLAGELRGPGRFVPGKVNPVFTGEQLAPRSGVRLSVQKRYAITFGEEFAKHRYKMTADFNAQWLKSGETTRENAIKAVKLARRYLVQNSTWDTSTAFADVSLLAYSDARGTSRSVADGDALEPDERVKFGDIRLPSMWFSPTYKPPQGSEQAFEEFWTGTHASDQHFSDLRVEHSVFWLGKGRVGVVYDVRFNGWVGYNDFIGSDAGAKIISKLENLVRDATEPVKDFLEGLLDW